MGLIYRIPRLNRFIFNQTQDIIKDGSEVLIEALKNDMQVEVVKKIFELSLARSTEKLELQLSSNITIRNIKKFYHWDNLKKQNPDVAELTVKGDNVAFIRHFFNKVLNVPSAYCSANLVVEDEENN